MSDRGVAVVTGASRGIGAAIAVLAAERGFAVCVNYTADEPAARQVVETITTGGGTARAVRADMGVEADIVGLFGAADELGPLAALVNNAGIAGDYGPVASLTAPATARMLAVNVLGPLLCAREAIRRMSTANGGAGGSIVNISSGAAVIGGATEWVAYAASKGALDTMTRGLAREVAAEGIRVNAVRPGLIDTEFNDHAPAGRLDRLAPTVPLGRAGRPAEIAGAVLWLLSDEASFTTGAILDVTGGR